MYKMNIIIFVITMALLFTSNDRCYYSEYQNCSVSENTTTTQNISNGYVNSAEKEMLSGLRRKIFDANTPPNAVIALTKEYIELLEEYLATVRICEDALNTTKIGITVITHHSKDYTFNIIRYDGNSIGHGTLERTWTFLQIIDTSGNIFVYNLHPQSAEIPLYLNVIQRYDGSHIMAVAGVTNASRRMTAFINFWIFSSWELQEFNNLTVVSEMDRGAVFNNMYFIEFLDQNNLTQFEKLGEDNVLSMIINNERVIKSLYMGNEVIIYDF